MVNEQIEIQMTPFFFGHLKTVIKTFEKTVICYLELSFWNWIETLILELEISSKDISNERK